MHASMASTTYLQYKQVLEWRTRYRYTTELQENACHRDALKRISGLDVMKVARPGLCFQCFGLGVLVLVPCTWLQQNAS